MERSEFAECFLISRKEYLAREKTTDDALRAKHLGISLDGYVIRKQLLIEQAEKVEDGKDA